MENKEEILRRKIETLRKMREIELQKKYVLKKLVEPSAYERLMNVRLSNPELYDQVLAILIQLYRSGRLGGKVSEKEVLSILSKLTKRRETRITFKRK